MGFIREPNGVDFVIAPASYTDADRMEVSAFFRKHKASKIKAAEIIFCRSTERCQRHNKRLGVMAAVSPQKV